MGETDYNKKLDIIKKIAVNNNFKVETVDNILKQNRALFTHTLTI